MDRRELSLSRRPATLPARWLLPLLCLLLLPATPAGAGIYEWKDAQGRTHYGEQVPDGAVDWYEYGSLPRPTPPELQFTLTAHGQPLPPQLQAQAEERMRLLVQAYRQLFRVALHRTLVVDAHAFDSQNALRLWIHGHTGTLPANIRGVYLHEHNLVGLINVPGRPAESLRTLLHEASHVLLAQLAPNAPPWLHEGLAQYFEDIDRVDGRLVVATHPRNDRAIRRMIERERLITLADYLSIPPARWRQIAHDEGNPVPYVVAWSLTGFLMAQPSRRQLLTSMLQDLEKAKITPGLDTFVQRYPGGLPVLEYDWFRWAMQPAATQVLD